MNSSENSVVYMILLLALTIIIVLAYLFVRRKPFRNSINYRGPREKEDAIVPAQAPQISRNSQVFQTQSLQNLKSPRQNLSVKSQLTEQEKKVFSQVTGQGRKSTTVRGRQATADSVGQQSATTRPAQKTQNQEAVINAATPFARNSTATAKGVPPEDHEDIQPAKLHSSQTQVQATKSKIALQGKAGVATRTTTHSSDSLSNSKEQVSKIQKVTEHEVSSATKVVAKTPTQQAPKVPPVSSTTVNKELNFQRTETRVSQLQQPEVAIANPTANKTKHTSNPTVNQGVAPITSARQVASNSNNNSVVTAQAQHQEIDVLPKEQHLQRESNKQRDQKLNPAHQTHQTQQFEGNTSQVVANEMSQAGLKPTVPATSQGKHPSSIPVEVANNLSEQTQYMSSSSQSKTPQTQVRANETKGDQKQVAVTKLAENLGVESLTPEQIEHIFKEFLQQHGASLKAFASKMDNIPSEQEVLKGNSSGSFNEVDAELLAQSQQKVTGLGAVRTRANMGGKAPQMPTAPISNYQADNNHDDLYQISSHGEQYLDYDPAVKKINSILATHDVDDYVIMRIDHRKGLSLSKMLIFNMLTNKMPAIRFVRETKYGCYRLDYNARPDSQEDGSLLFYLFLGKGEFSPENLNDDIYNLYLYMPRQLLLAEKSAELQAFMSRCITICDQLDCNLYFNGIQVDLKKINLHVLLRQRLNNLVQQRLNTRKG